MLWADLSGNDWAVIISAAGAFISAILSAVAAFMAAMAKLKSDQNAIHLRSQDVKAESAAAKADKIGENVQRIEKATNSINDALVKATGDARYAEGREVGRVEGKDKEKEK